MSQNIDILFSYLVRAIHASREADNSYSCICYTCKKKSPLKGMNVGHYIQRNYLSHKYDMRNVRPQCIKCNFYNEGMLGPFRVNLVAEYGEGVIREMEESKSTKTPPNLSDIENNIKEELNKVIHRKGRDLMEALIHPSYYYVIKNRDKLTANGTTIQPPIDQ